MSFVVTVTDIFTITSASDFIITKDKSNIFCCVSKSNTSVVEIWETTNNESKRNLVFSTLYSNFTTPSGATAQEIVAAIKTLITT